LGISTSIGSYTMPYFLRSTAILHHGVLSEFLVFADYKRTQRHQIWLNSSDNIKPSETMGEVATASDGTMKLNFDRQPRGGRKSPRWWLFSICESGESR